MNTPSLHVKSVSKVFNRRTIFRHISFHVGTPGSVAITGSNGSGKSTLVKIIAGLLSPTAGTVDFKSDGKALTPNELQQSMGFVAPYLQLYDEFSALENLRLLSRIRSGTFSNGIYDEILDTVGLLKRRHDEVRTFSSGMKQRLKYAFALAHRPAVLVLDEPTANLDVEGTAVVRKIIRDQRDQGLLIVATNEAREAGWCEKEVALTGSGIR